ncbi:MAG: DNA repair protein RecN [Anaerolineales bacterium]|nr:DNA repair protein RecN [Anaerolineales bacterium]
MLTELRIHNFAIIDHLELRFDTGLITFTGETGAGKSIIIDAIEALLGGRIDATWVRAEADRAVVEGDFSIPLAVRDAVHEILLREELLDEAESHEAGPFDAQPLTLTREIRLHGRSLARVNGRTANISLLRELGEYLVDVHGQSEHLSLLRVREHLRLLDGYAGVDAPLSAYRTTYNTLRKVQHDLHTLREAERDAVRRAEFLTYQIEEIDSARLKPGEEEDLKQERTRLANAESLATLAQQSLFLLDEGDPETQPITDQLGLVVQSLSQLGRTDPSQAGLGERVTDLFETLTDLARDLRDYLETIEFNPRRLEQVEERLDLLHNLKRKYGPTLSAVLEFAAKAKAQLDDITHAEERQAELEKQQAMLLLELGQRGQTLSAARRKAATQMGRAIENELNDLRMSGARFEVDFQLSPDPLGVPLEDGSRVAFGPQGLETVQFLIAPNPGEGLKPLAKIASGGETSRLMLALKNVLAKADHTPTLIFDEIDQGIGGRVGTVVGQKLWQLGQQHQVLCITHLPQLAAFGQQHYRVQKAVLDGRTSTVVEPLDGSKRLTELAQMMGDVSDGTLQSAQEILLGARNMMKD